MVLDAFLLETDKVWRELPVLSWREPGLMEILLMNWTDELEPVVDAAEAGAAECDAEGFNVLQLVAREASVRINMRFFNIF